MPQVSVIIPSYNRARMVSRAIQSVLDQTLEDFELIVVDDASIDNTEEVVRAYGDPRVKYFRHEVNRGAGAARNTGSRLAGGEYLTFLDSDDEWLPTKLEKQVEAFQTNAHGLNNLGVVLTGRARKVKATGEVIAVKKDTYWGELAEQVFLRQVNGGYMTFMTRRETFLQTGMFDEQLPACQDWDLLVRLANISQMDTVEEVLYVAYVHDSGRVHSPTNTLKAYRILFDKYRDQFSRHRRYEARLRANLAAWCLAEDRKGEAFHEALAAIRVCPWMARPYTYLALAVLGRKAYTKVASLKHRRQWAA